MSLRKQHQPLYLRAAGRLRRQVAKLPPGSHLPAESRLARQFDVSVATIREAIRVLAAEGLVEPQQGRGTVILPRQERPTGLLLNLDILDRRVSPFYLIATRECRRLLEAAGTPVRHYYGRATAENPSGPIECEEFFDDLSRDRLSGVIALGTFPEPRLIEALRLLPSAGMYEGFPRRTKTSPDQFLDTAIARALALGRRRIAVLAWNGALDPSFCNFGQFQAAMKRHGLSARPEWHRADLHPYLAGAGWETFREVWTARKERPDALIITDDSLFPDAAKAIEALSIPVPEELLVLTHTCIEAPVDAPFPVERLSVSAQRCARNLVSLLALPPDESACRSGQARLISEEPPLIREPSAPVPSPADGSDND